MSAAGKRIQRLGIHHSQHELTSLQFVALHDRLPRFSKDRLFATGGVARSEQSHEHESLYGSRKQQDEQRKERTNEQPIVHLAPPAEWQPHDAGGHQPGGQEGNDCGNSGEC